MTTPDNPTCWHLIRGAAGGDEAHREEFARRYLPTVRTYLAARWRNHPLASEIDDVTQEVFVALLRSGGALENADPGHGSGFRALLHGVARNVALHAERTRARRIKRVGDVDKPPEEAPADDPSLSYVFDRAYAESIVGQARALMEQQARQRGGEFVRRVELLRMIFEEGLPIRTIAERWQQDPALLHREYAKARREFREALAATVAGAERWSDERVRHECDQLLALLRT